MIDRDKNHRALSCGRSPTSPTPPIPKRAAYDRDFTVADHPSRPEAVASFVQVDLVRELDPTRPVTLVSHEGARGSVRVRGCGLPEPLRRLVFPVRPDRSGPGTPRQGNRFSFTSCIPNRLSSPNSERMRFPGITRSRPKCSARNTRRNFLRGKSSSPMPSRSLSANTSGTCAISRPRKRFIAWQRPTTRVCSRATGGPNWRPIGCAPLVAKVKRDYSKLSPRRLTSSGARSPGWAPTASIGRTTDPRALSRQPLGRCF